MASLPSNTFMFNYNAKEYNPATYTFPKTTGQLFDYDLVLNGAPYSYTDEYVDYNGKSIYMGYTYSTNANNPFNRVSSASSFTFIYKTSGFTSSTSNLFANRNNNYNYMVRGDRFHTSTSGFLTLTANTSPEICVIRISSNGNSEKKIVDSNGTTLQITTASTISWGGLNNGVGFFYGYAVNTLGSVNEYFKDKFYWMYCSMETLTDEEVLQVIQYNEKLKKFEIEPDTLFFSSNGGTQSVAINSDNPWTATTTDNWITISPTTGNSGEGTISITVGSSTFTDRIGTVTITDGEDNLTLTVNQTGYTKLPYNKLYMNGDNLN